MRFCRDYSYFNLGVAIGDICGALVLILNLGFWSLEYEVRKAKCNA